MSLPPEEAQEAARKRVVKLRAVLDTLGEDDRDEPDHFQGSSSEGRGPGPGTTNFRADQDY